MLKEEILIVDDEKEIFSLLNRILVAEGYEVEYAANGKESIEKMRDNLFNIVICDIKLPDIQGTDLILQLKDYNPLCNIIMITGYTSMDNVVQSLGNGAIDYFTKPIKNMELLISRIEDANKKIKRWKQSIPIGGF